MLKCPFCGFANEDGALFCEQCKSDLSAVAPAAAAPEPVPVAQVVESVAVADVVEPYPEPGAGHSPFGGSALPDPFAPPPHAPAVPAAEVVHAQPPVPEPVPAPLPQMAPPLEKEAAATQGTAAAPQGTQPKPTPAAQSPAAPPAAPRTSVPAGSKPKLVVKRGQKIGMEFPIYAEDNYVGRADEKPVDIDLEDQEPPDRVWCSRQHALIHFDEGAGTITLEDLNSSNGTYVNRERVYPGQPRQLFVNDTIQIGTVHLTLKV
jgi:hypothetical protein